MTGAVIAGLSAYALLCTFVMAGAIYKAFANHKMLSQALWREATLAHLLTRRRHREEGLPQPRAANGQFTAA